VTLKGMSKAAAGFSARMYRGRSEHDRPPTTNAQRGLAGSRSGAGERCGRLYHVPSKSSDTLTATRLMLRDAMTIRSRCEVAVLVAWQLHATDLPSPRNCPLSLTTPNIDSSCDPHTQPRTARHNVQTCS
jgi:hypothetical protein